MPLDSRDKDAKIGTKVAAKRKNGVKPIAAKKTAKGKTVEGSPLSIMRLRRTGSHGATNNSSIEPPKSPMIIATLTEVSSSFHLDCNSFSAPEEN